jgi:hypothetical protein
LPAFERRWNSVTEERAIPDHAERTERSLGRVVRIVPRYKDGFYIASLQLSAAVGVTQDPTALVELTGEGRTVTMLHHLYENTINSRGWMSLEVSYRLGGELKRKKLSQLDRIELKRVRHSAVVVTELSDWDIDLVLVDFVPKSPDGNVFLRSVSARSRTGLPLADVKLHATIHADGLDWRLAKTGPSIVAKSDSGLMGIAGRGALAQTDNPLEVALALEPAPRGAWHGTLALTAGSTPDKLQKSLRDASAIMADVPGAINRTLDAWQKWHALVPIRVDNQRAGDFIDGTLTLLKCMEAEDAMRLGTMIYPATSVYIRDNWWMARALLAAGRLEEAHKSQRFFYDSVHQVGVTCDYRADKPRPAVPAAEERGVELPASLALMWKDLAPRIGAQPKSEYEIIKRILSTVELTSDYRQAFMTDEGWVWPLDYPELALITENSLLLIEAMEYAVGLATDAGDTAQASEYAAIARKCRAAIYDRHFDARRGYYWYGLDRDDQPFTDVATTAASALVNHGFGPATDPRIYSSLLAAWKYCRHDGMLTSTTASPVATGFTAGQYLQAIADLNLPFAGKILDGMWRQCSATGNLWEGYDLYDYTWSGERQRAWDVSVGLVGLLRQILGIVVEKDSITFHPHMMASVGNASIENFRVGDQTYQVTAAPDSFIVRRDGAVILQSDRPLKARFTAQTVELTPQLAMFPLRELTPVVISLEGRTVSAGHWPGPMRVKLPELGLSLEARAGKIAVTGPGWRRRPGKSVSAPRIDFVVADEDLAPTDAVQTGMPLRVCGHAFGPAGAALGRVSLTWDAAARLVPCDERGWFCAEIRATRPGRQTLTVTGGGARATKDLDVAWHLANHADELIGFSAPAAAIEKTTGGHDVVVAVGLLRHKGFPTPIGTDAQTLIRFARTLPRQAIYRGENYVLARRGRRHEFVIRNTGHAWRDTLGFITDMRLWTTPLQPRAVNRYFSVMELAERFGRPVDAAPATKISLEIAASRPMAMDIQGKVTSAIRRLRTHIDPSNIQPEPIEGNGDYLAVRIRPARRLRDTIPGAMFTLEYESGARGSAVVELAFRFPPGCVPSIMFGGKLWERTLDEGGIEHNADGSITLRHVLHPGRRAYAKTAAAGFPISETFPLDRRNVSFEFARLM